MHIHSLEKITKLKAFRKKGYSINELVMTFSIPKTTVWHHVHSIKIPLKYLLLLKSKQGGRTKRFEAEIAKAEEEAKIVLHGQHRDAVIAFCMLYWGEGSKKACEFINSDGIMIAFYIKILQEVFNIPMERLTPVMRIFSGMNEKECLDYWSKITSIPKDRFRVCLNDGGTRGKTRYGMCRITIQKGSYMLKLIHALIRQIPYDIIQERMGMPL
ncbi:MAG: hypothetical protein Q7S63_02790 [bacterium]|nr:hypothetical protein [bacterium]